MSTLSHKGKINNQFKSIVFGYGRSIENELHNGIIPRYLLYLCLAYYYQDDYFNNGAADISSNKQTVSAPGSESSDQYVSSRKAYCKHWINCNVKQIAEWTLRIDTICDGGFKVMLMIKNNGSVTLNNLHIMKHAQSGDEYKVTLNTKERIFNVSKIGGSMINEMKLNPDDCDCKLVLQLDADILTITMTKFSLK